MADIKIDLEETDSLPILKVEGEVDVYTAPKLKSRILSLIDNQQYHMIIDLNGVDFMDSSGLGVLVGGLKRVGPHDGSITLVLNRPNILKIFRITGLDKVFKIYGSVEEVPK